MPRPDARPGGRAGRPARRARDRRSGMAHRGRLNVLAHIVGKTVRGDLRRVRGRPSREHDGPAGTGDVKYHLGAEGTVRASDRGRSVCLAARPTRATSSSSNPVVEGAPAREADRAPRQPGAARPDRGAAGAHPRRRRLRRPGRRRRDAQPERASRATRTGGTVHVIANNQIGFTTDPRDGRSTRYASDLAKGFDLPDRPRQRRRPRGRASSRGRLAMAYRERFGATCSSTCRLPAPRPQRGRRAGATPSR